MKLKKGHIYLMKYFHFKNDKEPLILVLYHGRNAKNKHLVHGLNLNYLSTQANNQVIDIIYQIMNKKIDFTDEHSFYHNYLKRNAPNVIKKSYRTYTTDQIGSPKEISRGVNASTDLLRKMNIALSDEKQVKKVFSNTIKMVKTDPEGTKKHILKNNLTSQEIIQHVENYMKEIKQNNFNLEKKRENKENKRHTYKGNN